MNEAEQGRALAVVNALATLAQGAPAAELFTAVRAARGEAYRGGAEVWQIAMLDEQLNQIELIEQLAESADRLAALAEAAEVKTPEPEPAAEIPPLDQVDWPDDWVRPEK